jgi:hypothetical protein
MTAVGTFGMSEAARAAFNSKGQNNRLFNTFDKGYTAAGLTLATAGVTGPAGLGMWGTGAAGAGAAGAGTAGVNGLTSAAGVAQSGGMPLMTKVLMGSSVASTLAGYFGLSKPEDYSEWLNSLDEADRAEVQRLEANLTEMQNNVKMRDEAVKKLVDEYPNIMAQAVEERKRSREAFDNVTQQVIGKAADQLAAKYAAAGGFSSGAFNQGLAEKSTDIALERAGMEREDAMAGIQDKEKFYAMRLAETEGLRDFQRTMLGQGMADRFSAGQAMLQSQSGRRQTAANIRASQDMNRSNQKQELFGSLGQAATTFALYNQFYSPNKAAAVQPRFNAPRMNFTNTPTNSFNKPLSLGTGYGRTF